jgi:hypothetical protein
MECEIRIFASLADLRDELRMLRYCAFAFACFHIREWKLQVCLLCENKRLDMGEAGFASHGGTICRSRDENTG